MGKEAWYRPYIPLAITFASGIALMLVDYFGKSPNWSPWLTARITFLLGLAITSLSLVIDKHWTKTTDQIKDDVAAIGNVIRNDIFGLYPDVTNPYITHIRQRLFDRGGVILSQLKDQSHSLRTPEQLFSELNHQINEMQGTEILAVCGDKDWKSKLVVTYYQRNYDKSELGVKVKRIFLQKQDEDLIPEEKAVLRKHISGKYKNVEGRFLFADDLKSLGFDFPLGFGFAILGDTVVVHWGFKQGKPEAGRVLNDPWFVEEHKRIFESLWNVATGEDEEGKKKIREKILGDRI